MLKQVQHDNMRHPEFISGSVQLLPKDYKPYWTDAETKPVLNLFQDSA